MEYFIGMSVALAVVSLLGTFVGFDRDRSFYPVVTIVTASYYDLFAVMGGSAQALSLESVAFAIFGMVSVIGFRTNLWFVAVALTGHGVFDILHPLLITNTGVPVWWPMFCMTFDVVAGLYMIWLLSRSSIAAKVFVPARHSVGEDS